jgi:hypothetical protein
MQNSRLACEACHREHLSIFYFLSNCTEQLIALLNNRPEDPEHPESTFEELQNEISGSEIRDDNAEATKFNQRLKMYRLQKEEQDQWLEKVTSLKYQILYFVLKACLKYGTSTIKSVAGMDQCASEETWFDDMVENSYIEEDSANEESDDEQMDFEEWLTALKERTYKCRCQKVNVI